MQQIGVNQAIKHHHVRASKQPKASGGDQVGIPGTSAHKVDISRFRLVVHDSGVFR